jgi:hypothetical protein
MFFFLGIVTINPTKSDRQLQPPTHTPPPPHKKKKLDIYDLSKSIHREEERKKGKKKPSRAHPGALATSQWK